MADIRDLIHERELRFMQGWMHRDTAAIRKLASRECVMVFATTPAEVLDRPSFNAAIENDFRCLGYRMGESIVRRYGKAAWFTTTIDLELKLGVHDWKGQFLMTGLWRKFAFGGWKLVERSIAELNDNAHLSQKLRDFQLWH